MKKLYLLSALLLCFLGSFAQGSIATSYNGGSLCTGTFGSVPVAYTSTGVSFQPGNVFTVQLSNAAGSFAAPTTMGTFTSTALSGTIYVSQNVAATPGSGYRIRVVSSNPALIGANNGSNITVGTTPQVSISPAQSSVCQGSSVTLTASGASTYSWMAWPDSSSLSNTTGQTVIASPSQTTYYTIMGTNAAGCSAFEMATVNVTQASLNVNSTQPVCPGGVLTLWAWGSGTTLSNATWTGPNGFTANGAGIDIVNFGPSHYGTYTVTATVGNCPNITATIQVGPPQGPIAYTSGTSFCPGSTIYLGADSVQQGSTYSWIGPNGFSSTQQNPQIPNASTANAGLYSVYEVLPGCLAGPSTVQVNVSPTLSVAAGADVTVNQGNTILLSAGGSGGNYQWTGPNGYTATGANPYIFNASAAHTGNYTVTLSSAGCPSVSDVMHVQVDLLNHISGTVFNDLNNNGVQDPGENAIPQYLVQLMPGYFYAYTDSTGAYSFYVPAGSYVVTPATTNNFQNPNPGSYTVGFTGTGQVSNGNNFGLYTAPNQNMGVSITESWNAAPGFTTKHIVKAKNYGTSPMSGTIKYLRDAQLPTLNSNTTSGYTLSGDTLIWTYTNLAPGATTNRYVYMTVPTTMPLGTALSSTAWVTPTTGDTYLPNNTFTLSQVVVGSWDPNDKLVQPAGPITIQQAAAGIDLVYTVRFQNTGTAPAVNVMVLDTLSDLLDLSTFELLSASHSYQLNVRNPRVLEFMFNNIMLPDSNTNEPDSHGYIQYRIKPNTSQTVGNVIENTAHIYFDFNEAIVTNTTQTELGVLSADNAVGEANALHLFPNPNSGNFKIRLTEATTGSVQVRMLNLLGQEVHTETAQASGSTFEHQVNTRNLSNGIYMLQLQQAGKTYTQRVVVQQ